MLVLSHNSTLRSTDLGVSFPLYTSRPLQTRVGISRQHVFCIADDHAGLHACLFRTRFTFAASGCNRCAVAALSLPCCFEHSGRCSIERMHVIRILKRYVEQVHAVTELHRGVAAPSLPPLPYFFSQSGVWRGCFMRDGHQEGKSVSVVGVKKLLACI